MEVIFPFLRAPVTVANLSELVGLTLVSLMVLMVIKEKMTQWVVLSRPVSGYAAMETLMPGEVTM